MTSKRLFLISLCIVFFVSIGISQQDPQFSQYMFNGFVVNPSMAGSKEQISSAILDRRQWLGASISPIVQSFSLHAPLKYQRIGLGFQANNENISIQHRLSISASYSYKINFAKGILSFGISGGVMQSSIRYSELNVIEDERSFLKNDINVILPDIGTGLYYQNKKFYIGLSALHLVPASINYSSSPSDINAIQRHFYFMAGYRWNISDRIQLLPTMLMKYISNKIYQIDFTTHIKYNDLVWAGLSIRTNDAMSIQAGLKISDVFKLTRQSVKIGYAFDWSNNQLSAVSRGSHEIMLIFDVDIHKKPSKIRKQKITISPVFF